MPVLPRQRGRNRKLIMAEFLRRRLYEKPSLSRSDTPKACHGVVVLSCAFGLLTSIVAAAGASTPEIGPSADPVPTFLNQHCQKCHSGEKPKGDFRVDSLTQDFSDKKNVE